MKWLVRTIVGLSALSLVAIVCAQQSGQTQRVSSLTGNIKKHDFFPSKVLGNKRNLIVYLPPDYDSHKSRRYPVLYMNDGQNVIDGMTSYIPNQEWRADETAQALIEAKLIEPIIIVGIDNAGVDRANEYLPTVGKNSSGQYGGKADLYARFLIEEVKPFIDKTYRTKKDAKNTGLCGSSFGGIVSLHLGLTHPNVFGKLGVVSPSLWWDNEVMTKRIQGLAAKPNLKIWMDIGTKEGPESVRQTEDAVKALETKGFVLGKDLTLFIDKDAEHNEIAWAKRFPSILMFLFGK